MKIYTKTGDEGNTGLFGGKRVSKSHDSIEAYGTVDELNSCIGLFIESITDNDIKQVLIGEQHKLFNIGSLLAVGDRAFLEKMPKVTLEDIEHLEQWIDTMTGSLDPLTNFILPGGSQSAAYAHLCRTVCRRAERRVVVLDLNHEAYHYILPYLNRLSDAFFVVSRYVLKLEDKPEIQWSK